MFDFGDDLINTRELVDRIWELEAQDTHEEPYTDEEEQELDGLRAIITETGAPESRNDGVILVNERYFSMYIRDECYELTSGYAMRSFCDYRDLSARELFSRAPFSYIDWDAYAADMRTHYSEIDIDGHTYYYQEY